MPREKTSKACHGQVAARLAVEIPVAPDITHYGEGGLFSLQGQVYLCHRVHNEQSGCNACAFNQGGQYLCTRLKLPKCQFEDQECYFVAVRKSV